MNKDIKSFYCLGVIKDSRLQTSDNQLPTEVQKYFARQFSSDSVLFLSKEGKLQIKDYASLTLQQKIYFGI